MDVEVSIPVRFSIVHPCDAHGAAPDYETGAEAADRAIAALVEDRAPWLALSGTPEEFDRRVRELQDAVARSCNEPCARDNEVRLAIYGAMRGFLALRGWGEKT